MKIEKQRMFALCGPAMMVALLVGFALCGFIPPPSPTQSAHQIATHYRNHTDAIRLGLTLAMFGAALLGPFVAMISAQLRRIEGRSVVSGYLQLALGTLLILEFIFPMMLLGVAAFRPGRSDTAILQLSDEAWLLLVGVVSTAVVELFAIGIAIRADRREHPVFPRWSATMSFLAAVLFVSGGLVLFFKTGPFAWDGFLSWWVALAAFGAWIVVMTVLLFRAVASQEREEAEAGRQLEFAGAATPTVTAVGGDLEDLRLELASLRQEVSRLSQPADDAPLDAKR